MAAARSSHGFGQTKVDHPNARTASLLAFPKMCRRNKKPAPGGIKLQDRAYFCGRGSALSDRQPFECVRAYGPWAVRNIERNKNYLV